MIGTRITPLLFTTGLVFAAGMARTPAYPDLKIVEEISVTRSAQPAPGSETGDTRSSPEAGSEIISPAPHPPAPAGVQKSAPQTITTYYKGETARVEAADGTVTLYDRAANQVFALHPSDKTYGVSPLKSLLEPSADAGGQGPEGRRMSLDSKVDLKEDKEAEKKTFAGEPAIRYALTGSAARKRPSRGGFPRGGGFPGGGAGAGGFRAAVSPAAFPAGAAFREAAAFPAAAGAAGNPVPVEEGPHPCASRVNTGWRRLPLSPRRPRTPSCPPSCPPFPPGRS